MIAMSFRVHLQKHTCIWILNQDVLSNFDIFSGSGKSAVFFILLNIYFAAESCEIFVTLVERF